MPDGPRVRALFRYPVKSMLGENVPQLDLDERGCVGDRRWSVRTSAGKIGSGKSTRRFAFVPGLLQVRATERDGVVQVTFPDGAACAVDSEQAAARLSRHVGQPVTFAAESSVSHYDDGPVSILGTGSVDALSEARKEPVDLLRFRANIVLGTAGAFDEEAWIGRRIGIGTAVLEVTMTSARCVMVNAQTADLPPQPGNLAAIGRLNDNQLGVIASVVVPGRVRVGDAIEVE